MDSLDFLDLGGVEMGGSIKHKSSDRVQKCFKQQREVKEATKTPHAAFELRSSWKSAANSFGGIGSHDISLS